MHRAVAGVAGGADLAGGGLDEVGSGHHGQHGRPPDLVVGTQFAGLQDHLQVGRPTGLFGGGDLVVSLLVSARQKRRAVQHDVHLIGPGGHCPRDLGQSGLQGRQPSGEAAGHTGHRHRAVGQCFHSHRHQLGVHTHRGHRGHRPVGGVGTARPGTQGLDPLGGVGSLQGGEVHHPNGQIQGRRLGRGLDRAGTQGRGPLLQPHRVHRGDAHPGHGVGGPRRGLDSQQISHPPKDRAAVRQSDTRPRCLR